MALLPAHVPPNDELTALTLAPSDASATLVPSPGHETGGGEGGGEGRAGVACGGEDGKGGLVVGGGPVGSGERVVKLARLV